MFVMWVTLLLAIYGITTILIHLIRRMNHYYRHVGELHVQLLVCNSEKSVEGTIRSLLQLSRLEGRPIRIAVYDFGSSDNTVKIIDALQKKNPFLFEQLEKIEPGGHVSLVSSQDEMLVSSNQMVIDLRQGIAGRREISVIT